MNKIVKDPLPGKNASRGELAEFWDTHSVADYIDQLGPAKMNFAKNLKHEVRITLDSESIKKLGEKAQKKGMRFDKLATQMVLEQLN